MPLGKNPLGGFKYLCRNDIEKSRIGLFGCLYCLNYLCRSEICFIDNEEQNAICQWCHVDAVVDHVHLSSENHRDNFYHEGDIFMVYREDCHDAWIIWECSNLNGKTLFQKIAVYRKSTLPPLHQYYLMSESETSGAESTVATTETDEEDEFWNDF